MFLDTRIKTSFVNFENFVIEPSEILTELQNQTKHTMIHFREFKTFEKSF